MNPEIITYENELGETRRVDIGSFDRTTDIGGGWENLGTGVTLLEVAVSPRGNVFYETDNRWQGAGYGRHWHRADPLFYGRLYDMTSGKVAARLFDLLPLEEDI